MQRTEWKFDYTAAKLAEAAQAKIDWHKEGSSQKTENKAR